VSTSSRAPGRARAAPASPLLPLAVHDLSWHVGDTPLLRRIDLALEARAGCTAIMGPNGAGKSVLLRLLNGLIAPSAGSIRWNGRPPDADVRRRQAFVFQRPALLRRSVHDNLDFVLRLVPGSNRAGRAARADTLLALAGLTGRERTPARRLSGGEQQRLALVCALATEPEILFLDEPTASLDPASTQAIERIVVDSVTAGTAVVLVTHDAGQARRLADSVIFLAAGRVTEHTPGETFFTEPRSDEARDYLTGRLVTRTAESARPLSPIINEARSTCP